MEHFEWIFGYVLQGIGSSLSCHVFDIPRELCLPIKLIWAESFAKKEIPSFYKQTCISPIYRVAQETLPILISGR